jgi:hypothetical protein
MIRQPFIAFSLAGIDLTTFGLSIPSPFCSLSVSSAQIHSFTSWELRITVVGDERKRSNIAAFETLLYADNILSIGSASNDSYVLIGCTLFFVG